MPDAESRVMDPAERYWRTRIATEIRNNCTLTADAMQRARGGLPQGFNLDLTVREVGNWVEEPPAWVGANTPNPGPEITGEVDETGKPEGYWKVDESPELARLTTDDDRPMLAEEPVEWRILRAFRNGYNEGLQRGAEAAAGRPLDHS